MDTQVSTKGNVAKQTKKSTHTPAIQNLAFITVIIWSYILELNKETANMLGNEVYTSFKATPRVVQ